jgi:TonB family protein
MTTFPRFVLLVLLASAAITQAQEMKRYTVEGDEFSVMLPKLPAMTTTRGLRYQDRKYQTHRQLETFVDGVLYIVEVYENPKPPQSLDEFISNYQNVLKCDPASERTFTVDHYSGKECSSANKEDLAKVQFFATETRLYRFLVRRRPDVSEDGAQAFFSSIRLGNNTKGIKVTDGPGDPTATVGPPDNKVRLLSKPEPSYTKEARKNKIAGTVILKVVFTSKGTVENIHVVRELPDGLTERAIEAAKKIKFVPATKDGHAVSMWMQLEYVFWP